MAPPRRRPADPQFCTVFESLAVIQGKWTLQIVQALLEGPKGFNELARAIGGCNPATLAQRLDRLAALGLVQKTVHSTMPPKTSYALTPAGDALQDVIEAVDRWGQRHLLRRRALASVRRAARVR